MSTSEHEYSESSSNMSPYSQTETPYSSPSQQVPHLANAFSGISCADDMSMRILGRPFLRILEQPQNYFRFRYKSEMVGTHGCLLGKTSALNKSKSHPTVELVNYTGQAVIRVQLAQADKDDEHPHQLLEDEQEDCDVHAVVPERGSYKVGFAGIGIIHTAKKDVRALLLKKMIERTKVTDANFMKMIRSKVDHEAKNINLNIVRLRFSAHNLATDKEICPPILSEPIHNMKSAATNDLKICRMSKHYGKPRGGEDVFILVEKVNKKNIQIRFFELNDDGDECWTANGSFLQNDVHHQYAIVFRTPPYRDPKITHDVKVFIELVRPSDGRTSEFKEYVYKPEHIFKNNKRKRVNSSFSSLESTSGTSVKSLYEVPATVEMMTQADHSDGTSNIPAFHIQIPQVHPQPSNNDLVADALFYRAASDSAPVDPDPLSMNSQLLGQSIIMPEPPNLQLNSAELETLLNNAPHIPSEERKILCETDWTEYMQSFGESLSSLTDKTCSMEFLRASMQLVSDSGKSKVKSEPTSPQRSASSPDDKKCTLADQIRNNGEYKALYKAEHGEEVKKLVKEICQIIKNKSGFKKQVVRAKLERLFELRLSNGDTFLHMALSSAQASFEYIVKLIHSLKMTHLLNLTNDKQRTILHLAVIMDQPSVASFLVSKECDPMLGDNEGHNVIHYAVICQSCLLPLLDAIKTNVVPCNLNTYNHDKQTPLHLAAIYNSESSARLLLQHGADYSARDSEGRTALHLAAYDDFIGVIRALLDYVSVCDIDAVDGRGNTALQIVCGTVMRQNSIEIVKLLLEKKADPLQHEEHNEPAWKLVRDKPLLREIMVKYIPNTQTDMICNYDIKSEPEDDFESADESESQDAGLLDLPLYMGEVSAILDACGAWRQLASRLHMDSLISWYSSTHSPTRTLLLHLKESGDSVTSKTLAIYLQEMGQVAAANIIRSRTSY